MQNLRRVNNPPARLAVFLPGLYGGGAERVLLNLAEGLARAGYALDLVVARAQGAYLAEVPAQVHLVDLGARRVLTSLPALARYLRSNRPHALLSALHSNLIAAWCRRLLGAPPRVIVSQHTNLSLSTKQAYDPRLTLMPGLAHLFYPWADGIVAVSQGVADDLARTAGLARNRIGVIYNPVITPSLSKKAAAFFDHPWLRSGQPPVVLGVGRLAREKDFPTLIRAFARLQELRPARLIILGEGPERPLLEALVRQLDLDGCVSLPGFVQNPYPYFARASVYALSSVQEALPTVLIEALYCEIPVVATDCEYGPREILADGLYGQLVPVGNISALAEAMARVLDGAVLPAPPESWHPYSVDTVADQYADMLLGR